jgi:hypothetical protein
MLLHSIKNGATLLRVQLGSRRKIVAVVIHEYDADWRRGRRAGLKDVILHRSDLATLSQYDTNSDRALTFKEWSDFARDILNESTLQYRQLLSDDNLGSHMTCDSYLISYI